MASLRQTTQVPLQPSAPPDSQLTAMTEVTSDCVNDLIGACMGLHFDPERPGKLARLRKVHVCASPLGSLDQFSRPLEIFGRLSLELSQDPVEHFAEAFSGTTRWNGRWTADQPPSTGWLANVCGHLPQTLPPSWSALKRSADRRAVRR